MRFRAVAAAADRRADRSSLAMRVRTRMCARVHVHVYTGSFFLRVALLLHGTSGHVPPATTPAHPGSPCHQATHFRRPRENSGPTYPRHLRDELFRSLLCPLGPSFSPPSQLIRARARARVCHFNKNLLTFPTPRTRTRRVSLAQARNCHWTVLRDVNDPSKRYTMVQILEMYRI